MRNRKWQLFILMLLLLVQCTSKKHNYAEEIPDPMKKGGYVSNPDHIISDNTTAALNDLLGKLDQAGKAQVAVVLLNSIGNQAVEDVSHLLFTTWKPGNKETNNGLVVLLVKDQHKIRFETGYGLEGDLPDVICFRIQQSMMLPYFKKDNYDEGMEKGLQAVADILTNSDGVVNEADNGDVLADTAIEAADAGVNSVVTDGGVNDVVADRGVNGVVADRGVNAAVADTDGAAATEPSLATDAAEANVATGSAPDESQGDPNYLLQDNGISRPGVGTIFFYFFYLIFSFIIFGILKGEKHKDDLYRTTWLAKSFVLLAPGIVMLVLCYALNIPYSFWITLGLCYLTWIIYLSYRYTLTNAREKKREFADRHARYEALDIAHKNLLFTAFVFPIPFLAYHRWHYQRMKKLRYEPYACDTCSQPMTLLNRNKKKAFMNQIQAAEEKVGSVIYDVWYCKHCDTHKAIGYDSIYTKVKTCPKCNNKTFEETRTQTVKRATEYSTGEGIQFSECRYCNFVEKKTFVIPRKSSSGSSSSSSGSSSSSSSGSWGGGSSGGGGSSSSW
ncbi:TPM domain-containing protein [Chitinophaga sancti]|uniref:TPM domain-containing protein n=1 Tax=Chitinophaga sancti TaxID=1004 RepID=UPI002A76652F|nr:TPM domain-containing protein [Chitinophaga sancti]WPQ61359.1 TPM domain-containing protein [Chitinophaga sancti]